MAGYKQGNRSKAKGGKKQRQTSPPNRQRRQTPRNMRRKS